MKQVLALLALLMALSFAHGAHAETLSTTNDIQYKLNRATPEALRQAQLGTRIMKRREHSVKCTYSFAVSGGSSAAAIALKDEDGKNCVIPNKAIIRDVLLDFKTALVSSNSLTTVSIGTAQGSSAGDLKNALAYYLGTGLVAGVPIGTAATASKMTADRTVSITIFANAASAGLTAGVMNAHIKYQLSE